MAPSPPRIMLFFSKSQELKLRTPEYIHKITDSIHDLVRFLGENSHCNLSPSSVAEFTFNVPH